MSVYYFGKVPVEYVEQHKEDSPNNWDKHFYFRVRVVPEDQEIKIEDSCGRIVPLQFKDIKALRKVLKLIKKEVKSV